MPLAHTYEVRPRRDKRGVDLVSDVLPFGRLWYGDANAVANAIGYAEQRCRDSCLRCRWHRDRDAPAQGRFQGVVTKLTAKSCIALCSSRNAVRISSARTTKRFPSRCASTIQIVRPSRSKAETQPKLQPASWRLSAWRINSFH
jgi:hypothetical protein